MASRAHLSFPFARSKHMNIFAGKCFLSHATNSRPLPLAYSPPLCISSLLEHGADEIYVVDGHPIERGELGKALAEIRRKVLGGLDHGVDDDFADVADVDGSRPRTS